MRATKFSSSIFFTLSVFEFGLALTEIFMCNLTNWRNDAFESYERGRIGGVDEVGIVTEKHTTRFLMGWF